MAVESRRASADDDVAAATALAALPADGWRVFRDVRWPGRPRAAVHHVVVGPSGVFVIDDRPFAGEIEVVDGVLRHDGRRRDRVVVSAAAAALAIADVLAEARSGVDPARVKPVLCVSREDPVFGWAEEVMVCSSANVATMLTSMPRVLDEAKVHAAAVALQTYLAPVTAPGGTAPPVTASGRVGSGRVGSGRVRSGRVRSAVVIAAIGTTATLGVALALPRWGPVLEAEARERLQHTHPMGEVVTVAGNPLRPELRVSVDGLRRASALRATTPARSGRRVLAAEVTIHNTGDRTWDSGPATAFSALDVTGSSYGRVVQRVQVRGGQVLPTRIRVRPGHARHGLVVFDAPAGLQVAVVRATVDPGLPRTLRWSVD